MISDVYIIIAIFFYEIFFCFVLLDMIFLKRIQQFQWKCATVPQPMYSGGGLDSPQRARKFKVVQAKKTREIK